MNAGFSPATFFIARRFLAAHRGYRFARFLTGVAVAGVATGVFAMTLVLAVMGGFRAHLQRKLLGFAPHVAVTVSADDRATTETMREVLAGAKIPGRVLPLVEGEGIIQRADQPGLADQGVKIRGIDPTALPLLTSVTWHLFDSTKGLGPDTALLGNELYLNLGTLPPETASIRLIAPFGIVTPAGELGPSARDFRIAGALRTGFFEHDTKLVLLMVDDAARLLGEQATHRRVCYLADPTAARKVAWALREALGPEATIQTWETENRKLFGALRLERIMMALLLGLMIFIASLSICGVVFMQVAWRRRDLAILHAVGATRRQVQWLVLHIGTWIGGIGSALGLAAAVAVGDGLRRHPIDLPASFYLDHLPIEMHWTHCAIIGGVGIGLAMAAALWPAMQAGREPVEAALRYE